LEDDQPFDPKVLPTEYLVNPGSAHTFVYVSTIQRMAIYDLDEIANTNQAVALIRPKAGVERRYLLHVLNSPSLVDHMHGQEVDVARANVSLTDVRNFPIPLAPFAEQQEIVRRVEGLFVLADQIEGRLKKAQAHVDKLTSSLLAKAFRGQLVPQDPNDEPAAVLLARIRARKRS
jgi:type I restriction enzyme, S subunit